MKEFKKDDNGFFICEECEKSFKNLIALISHITQIHRNKKDYFDKWLKEPSDGICLNCGKQTQWHGRLPRGGYKDFCDRKCRNEYGVSEESKEKIRKTLKETCLQKYNSTSFVSSSNFKKKILEKYNVKNPIQNQDILEKNFKKSKKIQYYKDSHIYFQGLYEFDFLEKYYNKFPDIERGPTITYKNNKKYFSDFYIPSLNLVIEIKSSWTYKLDENIKEKEKATVANGFNYIMIIDKDYSNFTSCVHL